MRLPPFYLGLVAKGLPEREAERLYRVQCNLPHGTVAVVVYVNHLMRIDVLEPSTRRKLWGTRGPGVAVVRDFEEWVAEQNKEGLR